MLPDPDPRRGERRTPSETLQAQSVLVIVRLWLGEVGDWRPLLDRVYRRQS